MKHGNFDALAQEYGRHRPGYSVAVARAIVGLSSVDPARLSFVDVGAGTGIWTRTVCGLGAAATAIEPSDPMREVGSSQDGSFSITWKRGSAEETGLADASADLLTMASSFHWADYDRATREFRRVLRPGGVFAALWNPRCIETNPLLVEIEEDLRRIVPDLRRLSSGRSEFCERLFERLNATEGFSDVLYLEGRHVETQSPERYLGLWRSVNDVRVQAGEDRFRAFLDQVERRIAGHTKIEATYLTRAWVARAGGL